MYYFERKMNAIAISILQLLYSYLGYKINLSYESTNGFELLIGMCVVVVIMNILDNVITEIACNVTGYFLHGGSPSSDKKILHWFIRVILYAIVYLISITPLCSILITPIVRDCTELVINWMNSN